MEPLTGFFILEGLTFDVIGAIFIVRGLFPINPYELKNVKEIEEDFREGLHRVQNLSNTLKQLKLDDGTFAKSRDELIHLIDFFKKENAQLGKAIPTQIRSLGSAAQHERSLDYAIRGLSCLLGGFTLQGIGVVFQLI